MKKRTVKIGILLFFVVLATIGTKLANNDKISSFGLMFSNLEALASAEGEGDYDQKIWEKFYRPDGTGYNCAKPGNETCTGR